MKYVPIEGIDLGSFSRRMIGSDEELYLNCVIDAITVVEAKELREKAKLVDKTNGFVVRSISVPYFVIPQIDVINKWIQEDSSLNGNTLDELLQNAQNDTMPSMSEIKRNVDALFGTSEGDSSDEVEEIDESPYVEDEEVAEGVTEVSNESRTESNEGMDDSSTTGFESEEDTFSRDNSEKPLRDAINLSFGTTIKNRVNMIMKRYDLLFESGYDLERPYGILATPDKVLYVDSDCVLKERSIFGKDLDRNSAFKLYKLVSDVVDFDEGEVRSASKISSYFIDGFIHNSPLIYFPYKMVEYAFGRNPTRKESNVYKYATATGKDGKIQGASTNWSLFKGKVERDVKLTIEDSVLVYCTDVVFKGDANDDGSGIDKSQYAVNGGTYFTEKQKQLIDGFIGFVCNGLSTCIIVTGYSSIDSSPASLRLRVCDPNKNFSSITTNTIVNEVFSGFSGGSQGTSLESSLNSKDSSELGVYELNHEFNHELSNALPLFAYKAYEHLRDNNEEISFDRLVLGRCDDGTILRNGTHGVNFSSNLFHNITAGSRSGKGVMTFNLLVGALQSGKAIFYLDNKPDMSSMLNQLAGGIPGGNALGPSMFVLNGGNFKPGEDAQQQFTQVNSWVNRDNIPKEAIQLFGEPSWGGTGTRLWGGLFYLRAYMLILGMVFARASGGGMFKDPRYNGENGFFVVCDEINELINEVMGSDGFIYKLSNWLPFHQNALKSVITDMERAKEKADGGDKRSLDKFENLKSNFLNSFSADRYYSLAMLASLSESLDYIYGMTNSGFNKKELEYSDIFLIGQNLEGRPTDRSVLHDLLGSERKIKIGSDNGANKSVVSELNSGSSYFPYAIFKFGSTDGIFGYNSDYPKYFGCDSDNSKAKSRLDATAMNFCYIPKFSMSTSKENSGNISDALTLSKANSDSTVYFKPYLILNDSSSRYTEQLFKNSKAPRESIIAEYPDKNDPTKLSPYIGFPEYLQLMGISNLQARLKKGADIANWVVGDIIKYPDDGSGRPLWLQFITDLRPEWIFSVKDITVACTSDGADVKIGTLDNELIKEYKEYSDILSSHAEWGISDSLLSISSQSDVNLSGSSEYMSAERNALYDEENDSAFQDSSNDEGNGANIEDSGNARGYSTQPVQRYTSDSLIIDGVNLPSIESTVVNTDDDVQDFIDIFDTGNQGSDQNYQNQVSSPISTPMDVSTGSPYDVNEGNHISQNSTPQDNGGYSQYSAGSRADIRDEIIESLLAQLNARNADINPVGYSVDNNGRPGVNCGFDRPQSSQMFDTNELSGMQFDSEDPETQAMTMAQLVKLVTFKVIDTYGGLDRVSTFVVSGDAIAINGVVFRSTIDDSAMGAIPLDVRRQLRAGTIASLFDFRYLKKMPRLSSLSFDSESFVYSYVRTALRYKSLGVDNFFDDLKALMLLKIGSNTFHRNTYKQDIKANDIFYYQSCGTKFAAMCDRNLSKFTKSSWNFTRNMFNSKDHGFIVKALGIVAGTAVSAVAGTAALSSKAVKGVSGQLDRHSRVSRGLSGFKQSLSDLFTE